MKDIRSILRLTYEGGLSVREVSDRLGLSKSTISTYLLRAREAGLRFSSAKSPGRTHDQSASTTGPTVQPSEDAGLPTLKPQHLQEQRDTGEVRVRAR